MRRFTQALFAPALLSLGVFAGSTSAQEADIDYNLMMIGGELPICSSMTSNLCGEVNWIDRDTMRIDRYMNLSSKYREAVLDRKHWPESRRDIREQVKEGLEIIHQRLKQDVISERLFIDEFTRRATRDLYENLADAEWNLILDNLEMPVPKEHREVVNLSENVNDSARSLVETYVKLAADVAAVNGREKPVVAVVTGSARDSLDPVDFYLSLFEDAGAKAIWLPIDAAVVEARRDENCADLDNYREEELGAWKRAEIHTDKHKAQLDFCQKPERDFEILAQADAVFFSGGDQNLLRNALVEPTNQPSELLREIYNRLTAETLLVGGTSAGASVLTGKPMISNGTSASAMRDGAISAEPPKGGCDRDDSCPPRINQDSLTYHPLGGLDLFPYASLDTSFSERGRHGRLLRLAATTATPLAIGIDEATSLLVNSNDGRFQVYGERGVFFAQDAQQTENAVASTFHYLLDGSSGVMTDRGISDVELSDDINIIKVEPTTKFMSSRGAMDALRLLCRDRKQMNLVEGEFTMQMQVSEDSTTKRTGGECQVLNGQLGVIYQPQEKL